MSDLSLNHLRAVSGVGPAALKAFAAAGYNSLNDLQGVTTDQLTAIPGVGPATAQAILEFLSGNAASDDPVQTYRHDATRKNIPPAGLAGQGKVAEAPTTRYFYDPHLPPVLRFDETGQTDKLPALLQKAAQEKLSAAEVQLLADALRQRQPWLEWAGKREKAWFDVDPVALHIHERVAAEAIIATARRRPLQPSLFADPELEYREAIKFYQHDMEWANRLILGDSLTVMHSLARREDLAGKVQMIYMDPPYGIKFSSNFQPLVSTRRVDEKASDLTREPEQIRAYRDTWTLGVHSYLTYLKDRIRVAKDLLTDSGSMFVQISDENLHRVRLLLDEIFGPENFVSVVTVKKTGGMGQQLIDNVADYLLWYARDISKITYHSLHLPKVIGEGSGERYSRVELADGHIRPISSEEQGDPNLLPKDSRVFLGGPLTSETPSESTTFTFEFEGRSLSPRKGGWKTNRVGINRLIFADRLLSTREFVNYKIYITDYPAVSLGNLWTDTMGTAEQNKVYVVQTTTKVVERCLLMTTDPGDLVLDPTCGSGTSAFVAEKWGRRWITIDTSRVALSIARQRMLTADYDYLKLTSKEDGLASGFEYETIPHISLNTITRNSSLDALAQTWEPILAEKLAALNTALAHVTPAIRTTLQRKLVAKEKQEGKRAISDADRRRWLLPQDQWQEWEVPFDTDPDWPDALETALSAYRQAWRSKMDEVNAAIAASAPQEVLVDQPLVVRNVLRVSGPFTVEGVQPIEQSPDPITPIGGAPEELDAFAQTSGITDDPVNAEAYLEKMIRLLRQDGVRFPDNKVVKFSRLDPLSGDILHAEGEWELGDVKRLVVVAFGPQYGPITAQQVEDCLRFANRRGCDDLVLAGFTIDGAAQAIIQEDPHPRVRTHLAHIRPDVNMGDLLKDTPSSQLFTVFGEPRVNLQKTKDGEYVVTMAGVDIYDPVNNTIQPTQADKVAAWFLDADYDGATFCISQAFFPDKTAWDKLAKALKTLVDPQRFAAFSGTTSLPFPAGKHRRTAVKVIDPRGNEVMRVLRLDGKVTY